MLRILKKKLSYLNLFSYSYIQDETFFSHIFDALTEKYTGLRFPAVNAGINLHRIYPELLKRS